MSDIRTFLHFLFRDATGFVEIRALPGGLCFFYPVDQLEAVEAKINELNHRYNVFVGVCPRHRQSGTKADVKQVSVAWSDVDAKDFGGDKGKALEMIQASPVKPSLIVDSGNGYHVYWRFNRPIPTETQSQIATMEALNIAIRNVVRGDKTQDISRILRVPGTYNIKDPQNPKLCQIVSYASDDHAMIELMEAFQSSEVKADEYTGDIKDFEPRHTAEEVIECCHLLKAHLAVIKEAYEQGRDPKIGHMARVHICHVLTQTISGGDEAIHAIYSLSSNYDRRETQKNIDYMRKRRTGALTCAKLQDTLGTSKPCEQCKGFRQSPCMIATPILNDFRSKKALAILEPIIEDLAATNDPNIIYRAGETLALLTRTDWVIFKPKIKAACKAVNLRDLESIIKEARALLAIREGHDDEAGEDFYESDGQYFSTRYVNGIPIASKVSNFILEPIERIVLNDEDDELMKFHMRISGSERDPLEVMLRKNDTISWRDFVRSLPGAAASWYGSDVDVQKLRNYLKDKEVVRRKGTQRIGLHGDQFVMPNGTITADGLQEQGDLVYINRHGGMEQHAALNSIPQEEWITLAKELLPRLLQIQDPLVMYRVIGWFFISPFCPVVRKAMNNEFPLLRVWATKESGKTSLVQVFWRLFGVNREPFSCNIRRFPLINLLDSSNAVPVVFDEYKVAEIPGQNLDTLHATLREAYRGGSEPKGRMDQTLTNYQFLAPAVVIGEDPFKDEAINDRIVLVCLDGNYLSDNPRAVHVFENELLPLNLDGFLPGFLQWVLSKGYLKKLPEIIHSEYARVKTMALGKSAGIRTSHNLATMFAGIDLFCDLCQELGIRVPQPNKTELATVMLDELGGNKRSRTALDDFMLRLANFVSIDQYRDSLKGLYKLERSKQNPNAFLLYLHTDPVLMIYEDYISRNKAENSLSKASIERQMQENSKSKSRRYIIVPRGHNKRLTDKGPVRCTVIDAVALEESLGIPVSTWDSDNAFRIQAVEESAVG